MKPEVKGMAGLLRKGLRNGLAVGRALVPPRSVVLMEWKGPDPDGMRSGEKGCR